MYTLKPDQPAIEVVDGAFAGRKFLHGMEYAEVPPEEAFRFDQVAGEQTEGGEQ